MPFSLQEDVTEWNSEELIAILEHNLDETVEDNVYFYDARGLKITL